MNDYVPTEDVEAPFSVTLRTGSGYDAALLTIRGNDAVQLIGRLGELEANDGLARVVEFNSALQAKAGASAPSATGGQSGGSPSSQRDANSRGGNTSSGAGASDRQLHPEGLKCPKCQGAVIYKEIKSKAGKTFKLWVCENQRERNDGHHSEFIN